MNNEYINVCSFGSIEFGYYDNPYEGVGEYKVVARFWDIKHNFLDEKILSYEDSPGDALKSLSFYVTGGYTFNNCYGTYPFKGGYELLHSENGYIVVRMSDVIEQQI